MKYKAIFLDVDGTTVVHGLENLPTDRVTKAIISCRTLGVNVCLATSRTLSSVRRIIDHLNLFGYHVISSGAQIYDGKSKKIIIEKSIPTHAIELIYHVAKKYNASVKFFDGEKDSQFDGVHIPKKVVGAYFPEIEPQVLEKINDELESVEGIALHRMESWKSHYECLDITQKEVSKLHGIVDVVKLLNIDRKDVIGVGDGYNDFPLLLACGLKIAMGNAVPELKAIADFVAPSVDEDGVATVIEKFILS
ncbi:MAG: HAD family hydrolase [Patescibacteria group bacterium]